MWALVGWINLRYMRLKVTRTIITLTGIALGVAMVLTVLGANRTIMASYQRALTTLAGDAEVQVTGPGEGSIAADLTAKVSALPGVGQTAPVVKERGLIQAGEEFAAALIYAVDWAPDSKVRRYVLAAGSSPTAGSDHLWALVGQEFARQHQISLGDRIAIWASSKQVEVEVVGLLAPEGVGRGNQGQIIVVPLPVGQEAFGKVGTLDAIDIVPSAGTAVEAVIDTVRAALPSNLNVGKPAERGQEVSQILEGLKFMMWFSAAMALFSGIFIVYTNVALAMRERRRDLGILRALGLSRSRSALLMMAEAVLLGLFGSALGLVMGVGMTHFAVGGLAKTSFAMFAINTTSVTIGGTDLLIAGALGLLTTLVSAYMPAREAYSVQPVEVLRPATLPINGFSWRGSLLFSLFLIVIVAFTTWLSSHGGELGRQGFLVASGLALLGAGISIAGLGPLWLHLGHKPVTAFLRRCFGISGHLAGENLVRNSARSASSMSAFLLAIAFMVGFTGFTMSYTTFVDRWVDRTIGWDLRVSTGIQGIQAAALLPEEYQTDLQAVPGVAFVSPQRFVFTDFEQGKVLLSIFDMKRLPEYASLKVVAGAETPKLYAALADGDGVAITTVTARLYDLHVGDAMKLPTPVGIEELPVLAIVDAFSPETGEVYLDRGLYQRYWSDKGVDAFVVKVVPGQESMAISNLTKEAPRGIELQVETQAGFKERLLSLLRDAFNQVYGLVFVTIMVGCLAILNTLTIAVMERRTEVALLRAIGSSRKQVGYMVFAEAFGIGIFGAVLGGTCGLLLARTLTLFNQQFSGLHMELSIPLAPLVAGVSAALLLAPLSALLPIRLASRMAPVEALRSE
jgi:putative ABC transport system permease protein